MGEITINRKSPFLRFFLWVWKANPEKLNICKLFWGTILFFMAFFPFLFKHSIFFFKPDNKIHRSIPWAIPILILAALYNYLSGLWFMAVPEIVILLAYACVSLLLYKESKEEKGEYLSRLTRISSLIVEFLIEEVIFRTIDFRDNVTCDLIDSKPGRRIKGFFGVIGQYLLAIKRHSCMPVKVVD